MDAVVIFFGKARANEIHATALTLGLKGCAFVDKDWHCFFHEYSPKEQESEFDESELAQIREAIGGAIVSAFLVESGHGMGAKLALHVIDRLMSEHQPAVLYDVHGGLWSPVEIVANLETDSLADIYSLRRVPNISLERTRER